MIMVLAIVIPILVICAILWHFGAFDGAGTPTDGEQASASIETQR